MNHQDHVQLITKGIPTEGGVWADLGSGTGAFTLALADILGHGGFIYSVDSDNGALRKQVKVMQKHYKGTKVKYMPADFTQPIKLPRLDGILMANSLHFVFDKLPVIELIRQYLKPEGRLIIVEYNTNNGNRWVPHPLTYSAWENLAQQAGFAETELLMTRPSSFLDEFFSAVSITPPKKKKKAKDESNP